MNLKYLKYAFGEIVLVVIGIFIAIQLNAYYEHKKLTKEHQIHLQKLVGELDDNIARLNFLAHAGDSVNVSLERANQGLSETRKLFFKTFEMSQLGYVCDLPRSYGGSLYNLKDITYQELLNTGKLFTLGNDELIDGIVDYYKRIERENFYLNLNNAENRKSYDQMEDGWIRLCWDKGRADYLGIAFTLEKHHLWIKDRYSKEYLETIDALRKRHTAHEAIYAKVISLKKHTITLKENIENHLTHDYHYSL